MGSTVMAGSDFPNPERSKMKLPGFARCMLETILRAHTFGSSNSSALTKTGVTPQRRFILRTTAGSVDNAKIGGDNLVEDTTDADFPPRLLTTTAQTAISRVMFAMAFATDCLSGSEEIKLALNELAAD